ncbi:hypothetical protein PV326_012483 [Microctonus aethiopoides]|nr:hypothetical protein PV326_012483 [Microctonus aethiopoides]
MESIGTTPHKGLCTLFDRGKYIWNGGDESNEKKDRMEKVKKCQFPESRATNCLSNRFNRPLNNRKKHFHSVEENCSGIINGKKNNDCTFDIKKCKITKWKSHNSASHSDDQQTRTKSLGYCHGNCCKTKSKFCKEGKLSQMMKKEEDSKLGTKTSCNHSPKSTPNSFSHNHHHYQQATGHQTKDQCGKLESPHELDVHHRIKPSGRQNYSSCPGAKNVNQLLAPRDNESHICRHESYQLSENNQQLRYNPSLKHFEIVSKKSVIDDNIKKQVSTDDECDTKKLKLFKEIPEIPTTLLLHRSRSLPQLSAHDSGVESVHDNNVPARCHSKLVSDLRQLLTLKQHYYPEGGWGWIILVVCIFIQILSHGTHGAVGVFVIHVATKFNTEVYLQAGKLYGVQSILSLSHTIILYDYVSDVSKLASVSFTIIGFGTTCGKMFVLIFKRKNIGDLMKVLETQFFNPQDAKEMIIYSKSCRDINKFHRKYTMMMQSTTAWVILTSLIWDIPNKALPYDVWLPFSLSTSIAYWSTYVNHILAFLFTMIIVIGYDIMVMSMMMIICQQLKLLSHRFAQLHPTIDSFRNSSNDQLSAIAQINLERKLITKCVKHHIAILELSKI